MANLVPERSLTNAAHAAPRWHNLQWHWQLRPPRTARALWIGCTSVGARGGGGGTCEGIASWSGDRQLPRRRAGVNGGGPTRGGAVDGGTEGGGEGSLPAPWRRRWPMPGGGRGRRTTRPRCVAVVGVEGAPTASPSCNGGHGRSGGPSAAERARNGSSAPQERHRALTGQIPHRRWSPASAPMPLLTPRGRAGSSARECVYVTEWPNAFLIGLATGAGQGIDPT